MKVTATDNHTLTVDIHGMRGADAEFRLINLIENGSDKVDTIVVIHGFNGGQVLKETVRGLKSERIKKISPGENSGITKIKLKKSGGKK